MISRVSFEFKINFTTIESDTHLRLYRAVSKFECSTNDDLFQTNAETCANSYCQIQIQSICSQTLRPIEKSSIENIDYT